MTDTGTQKNNRNNKLLIVVLGVAALVGIVSHFVSPITIEVGFLRNDIEKTESRFNVALRDHENLLAHVGASAELKTALQKFAEVETQFDAAKELMESEGRFTTHRLEEIEDWLKVNRDRVAGIRALEREVYGKPNDEP